MLGLAGIYFILVGIVTGKIPYPSKFSYALPDADLAVNPEGYWYSILLLALGTLFFLIHGVLTMKKVVYRGPERLEF